MSYLTIICGSKVYGITGVEVQEANDSYHFLKYFCSEATLSSHREYLKCSHGLLFHLLAW